jgi:hypothetical protein
MDLDNTEYEWKNDAPSLSGIGNSSPFSVPEDYFNNAAQLINALAIAESFRFKDEEEFAVPENYFEQLSDNIKSGIAVSTLQDEIKEDGFSVPEGYFESLSSRINSQINVSEKKSGARVHRLLPSWAKYAAAASITTIIGSVAFFNLYSGNVDRQMGKIPEQEIINYLEMNSDVGDTPAILENLSQTVTLTDFNTDISSEEMELYINTTL